MEKLDFRAMGSQMMAVIDSERAEAKNHLARVPVWFEQWEAKLSRFREESELSHLNREGQATGASAILWEVLHAALGAARETGGLVTPTTLPALEALGYDRTFEAVKGITLRERKSNGTTATVGDWRKITLDVKTRSIYLPPGVRLDFGGTAKGWAADKAARRLAEYGPALVDAGGDIAVSGPTANGEGWPIGVADPLCPEREIELLMLRSGGVATSGRDYRRWRQGDIWRHHILDPRTGEPANTDMLSATIMAPSASRAEVAAKVVLIFGSKDGMAWLEAQPDLAGLLVLDGGKVLRSRRLAYYAWGSLRNT